MPNKIKKYLEIFLVKFICFMFRIFWIFPIRNNQICFITLTNQYTCNPKYIYEYLKAHYGNELFYIWVINSSNNICDSRTVFVRHKSLKRLFYFLTSKILITSSSFPVYLPYRKKQVLINTWHGGGAYKKVGILKSEENSLTYRWGLKKTAQDIDFFISSNKAFTKGISNSFFIKASKFLPYGMPRNDLFFSCSMDKSMIKKKIGVDVSTSIILYAPTFRGKSIQNNYKITNTEINLTDVINTANMKFSKKFVILYRSHYVMENIDLNLDFCKNVTAYPDMQELLYVSDILITDYSSSMWDFSFTFRPGFLFTPDIEEYKNERDFYTPISEWPFPFATTNEQLCENILKFNDEDNINKIRRHHTMLGSYENGDATQRISELILSLTLYETKK